ncbi:hypothetical protein [Candidatus Tisiphia endosymbiont of Piscicola geometra]|uniref:hypothetical protein n=1 Tax=Candidatus Tisiphia endosymbiont of Piscicola geometra TaxID=3066273 RepID=UPI00312C8E34
MKEQELAELKRQLNTGHSFCQNCPSKDQLLQRIKILEQDLINGNYLVVIKKFSRIII